MGSDIDLIIIIFTDSVAVYAAAYLVLVLVDLLVLIV